MLNTLAFAYQDEKEKPVRAPFLCWDLANPALEKRIQIHNDIQEIEYFTQKYSWQTDINFKSMLLENYTIIVANLAQEIEWVSHRFQKMTGYSLEEAVGRKPSFLQGEKTNPHTKRLLKEKLVKLENIETKILNYRKNGESYWCGIRIFPIHNSQQVLTHYVAIEKEVN